MVVEIKRWAKDAKLPVRGSEQAAGYDLWSQLDTEEEVEIKPGETVMIGTGVSMAIPEGYFGGIFARSGMAIRGGLRPANCVGVIDSDYRGEIKVALHNDSNEIRKIRSHERIAQIVILPYLGIEFHEVDNLDDTKRGFGGFGSTGRSENNNEDGKISIFDYLKMCDNADKFGI